MIDPDLPHRPSGAPPRPAPISRREDGRWLAGVAAGLGDRWDISPGLIRAGFVLAALVGGIGAFAYVACWLILPADNAHGAVPGRRGAVALALAGSAVVGLISLAALAATLTLFGFGWISAVLAIVVLAGALTTWPRVGPPWALLPVAALALPSLAVAAIGLRLDPSVSDRVVAPADAAAFANTTYRSGLGHLLVDLRRTTLPDTGVTRVNIDAGIRRTIVALPTDRCVHVEVRYEIRPLISQVAAGVSTRPLTSYVQSGAGYGWSVDRPYRGVRLFGASQDSYSGIASNFNAARSGPRVLIGFHSEGGSLYVRDYPADVSPAGQPDWPGYPSIVEDRPTLRSIQSVYDPKTQRSIYVGAGFPTHRAAVLARRELRRLVGEWRKRSAEQQRSKLRIDRLLPGPCGR